MSRKKLISQVPFPSILTNLIDEIEKNDFDLTSLELAAGLEMPDTDDFQAIDKPDGIHDNHLSFLP